MVHKKDPANNNNMFSFDLTHTDYDEADGSINGLASGTSGTVDAAFRKVQRHSSTFLIWRIENLAVVALPKEQYGTFFDADSYIIYVSSPYGQPSGTDAVNKEIKGTVETHVHFWLGRTTTADKSGIAAYKTVELDGYLGGVAVQHRETQENESPRFKSYFKNGMRVLKGGTASGLRHIVNQAQPKLYKVKGKSTPILIQLEAIAWNHFNSGDVFIIQTEKIIFVWVGRAANAIEKLHSAKIAQQIKSETSIPIITFIDDGYEQTLTDNEKAEFQRYLPLDKRHVLPSDGQDDECESKHRAYIKLYRCSDINGKYRVTEIKTGPLLQADLDSDDVFILDHGSNGIWVWVGKRASERERLEAMRNARGFVKKKKYPNNTNVTRVVDGGESLEFKMLFLVWDKKEDVKNVAAAKVLRPSITKFDALTMLDRPALAAETQLVDDGTGTTRVWRIKNFDVIELPKEKHGTFFSGDCYIIWYNYKTKEQQHIVYYWLGSNATKEETQCAASKAKEIDDELDGKSIQIRVIQGYEPPQLLQLFKGKMIVYKGQGTDYDVKGVVFLYAPIESGRNLKHPTSYLLHIFGSTTYSTRALQVPAKAASLNSAYCFVLKTRRRASGTTGVFIWCGSGSNGDQREMAKSYIGVKEFELALEGKESADFWEAIGGRGPYETTGMLEERRALLKPSRLFHCSTASGSFKVEEIFNFSQADLIPEDVMLLDANDAIFVWIGKLSTKEENRLSSDLVNQYLKTDPSGRSINCPVVKIRQGYEPPNFIGFFKKWNYKLWMDYQCFEEMRSDLEGGEFNKSERSLNSYSSQEDQVFDKYDKYPITILRGPMDKLPSKVDPLSKELHLTHDDFVALFNMKFQEFEILPRWKQQEMKKKVGLF